jgi:hypothetical protein
MRHQYWRDRAISNHHKRPSIAVAGVARPYLGENHGYRVLLIVLTKDGWGVSLRDRCTGFPTLLGPRSLEFLDEWWYTR